MPMYNLVEYSDNYQDSSATLYQYKRDEPTANLATNNSSSFKYKVNLLGNPVVATNVARLNVKIVVPLKYSSNFFISLEMPLINCKIKLNLTWKKECVLSTDNDADADSDANNPVFIINDTKLYVLVVTLSKEDNKDFIKILLNNKIKVFKDLFIGMNIKQKNKMKMQMLMFLSILI